MHVSFHPDGEGSTAWAGGPAGAVSGASAPAAEAASAAAARQSSVERASATPTLSCIVPAYNEAANLRELLPRLRATLEACVASGLGGWEILIVDDGSADGTAELLRRWGTTPGVRGIRLSRNFGKEAALSAGLVEARGDLVLMMDADLQHDPALIPSFVNAWRRGADMIYAVRENRDDEGALKRWGSRGFYALLNRGARFAVPADAGDFRLMDRRVVDTLLALPERNRFMKGLYAWVGFNTLALPYTPAARAHGETKFRPVHLARLALDGLTAFTNWPLRAVSACGILLAVPAFLYGAYLTALYLLYGHNVSGWTTIVVGLMLFSGLQLVSLGIVGEYVGRIFEEVKGRPLYVVGERSGRGLPERQA